MIKGDKENYEELEYGIKRISQWYRKNIRSLSIMTSPYNSCLVFKEIIIEVIKNREKVLYIWGKDIENFKIINELKQVKSNVSYSHIKEGNSDTDITFVDHLNVDKVKGNYGLVIIDDITTFSFMDMSHVIKNYERALKIGRRVIIYSIESLTNLGEQINLAPIDVSKPFVEPRILTTRIDLEKDIPYILYDYIKWFKVQKKKVMIFVPDREKVNVVYDYYINILKLEGVRIDICNENNFKKDIKNVLKVKDKATFIITNYLEGNLEEVKVDDAIVLFADNKKYSYKKLLYLCGQIGINNKSLPEVLFVSNEVSENMDKAKEISREYNKMIWRKKSEIY